MANQALFLGWSRATAGREQQAMGLWGKTMEPLTRKAQPATYLT